ncbi:MAG TPA: redoxin domain-containing protein [Candidatus Acidoferrales bacterium]|nr:redoxin domain-containing protein [Candidatus Acidoferrales bacterium]
MMERQVDELQIAGTLEHVITVGSKLPSFRLADTLGKQISSKTLLKRHSLVLFFYRGTWCPFCNAELESLVGAEATIRSFTAQLVGITPQRPEMVEAVRVVRNVGFPILIDRGNEYAASLGLCYGFPGYLRSLYQEIFNTDLSKVNAGSDWQLPVAARIVVDRLGVVRLVEASLDYRTRPPLDHMLDVLRRLAAIQDAGPVPGGQ